jgi:hypothetical protein
MVFHANADFLDIGSSHGGALTWAEAVFGCKGLGIDKDPRKVAKARSLGRNVAEMDATQLNFDDDSFAFSVSFDFLEHLPTHELVVKVLEETIRVSRDFCIFALPHFDNEVELRALGLKRYYTDWRGHTCHMTSDELNRIARRLGHQYIVATAEEIWDSSDPSLLPLTAPEDQFFFDPAIHLGKPSVRLPRKRFYNRTICVIRKTDRYELHDLLCRVISCGHALRTIGMNRESLLSGDLVKS